MFDIGASELLVIVIVAIIVIGPKDMPMAMRTAGRWIGKIRRVSSHFRSGIDAMVREAEMEEMEKKWKAQNEAIMAKSAAHAALPDHSHEMTGPPPADTDDMPGASAESRLAPPPHDHAHVNDQNGAPAFPQDDDPAPKSDVAKG